MTQCGDKERADANDLPSCDLAGSPASQGVPDFGSDSHHWLSPNGELRFPSVDQGFGPASPPFESIVPFFDASTLSAHATGGSTTSDAGQSIFMSSLPHVVQHDDIGHRRSAPPSQSMDADFDLDAIATMPQDFARRLSISQPTTPTYHQLATQFTHLEAVTASADNSLEYEFLYPSIASTPGEGSPEGANWDGAYMDWQAREMTLNGDGCPSWRQDHDHAEVQPTSGMNDYMTYHQQGGSPSSRSGSLFSPNDQTYPLSNTLLPVQYGPGIADFDLESFMQAPSSCSPSSTRNAMMGASPLLFDGTPSPFGTGASTPFVTGGTPPSVHAASPYSIMASQTGSPVFEGNCASPSGSMINHGLGLTYTNDS